MGTLENSLFLMVAQAGLKCLAVSFDSIGPEIIPHQRAVLVAQRDHPRDHCWGIEEYISGIVSLHSERFGFLEGLHHCACDPTVLFVNTPANDHGVHDRENA